MEFTVDELIHNILQKVYMKEQSPGRATNEIMDVLVKSYASGELEWCLKDWDYEQKLIKE